MKHLFLIIIYLAALCANAQAPSNIKYGEYKFSRLIDSNGNTAKGFQYQRITPIVLPAYHSVPANVRYIYVDSFDQWRSSDIVFNWSGSQNGWYVYTYRYGSKYYYFLISHDLQNIRIQEPYIGTGEYTRCDPNEKMNGAPTY